MNKELMQRYENLKSLVDGPRREDFLNLMSFLEKETEYLIAPASNRYHLCVPMGLLEHSVLVTETMIKMKKILAPETTIESCVICGLLHDCGKENQYKENEPTEKQKQYGFKANPPYSIREDITFMPHEIRSLYYIHTQMALTEEEWSALALHNEPWTSTRCVFKKNKLMTLLQYSDYWSTLYLESDKPE